MEFRVLPFLPILARLLSGCVFLYGPQFLPRQPRPALLQGRRVRVFVPASDDYIRIATLVALSADSIVLERAPIRSARMPFAFLPAVLLGGFLGSRIETERWDEVSLDEVHRLRMGLTPQPAGRVGLGASLAF